MVRVPSLAGQCAEADEGQCGDRVGGRRCVVHQILLPGDELFAVVGDGEQATVVDVPEVIEHRVGRIAGMVDPRTVARCLGKSGEGVDDCRVIGSERGMTCLRLPVGLPRPVPATVVSAKVVDQKAAIGNRRVEPVGAIESCGSLGQRGEHQPVPFGQDLVVEERAAARASGLEQPLPCRLDLGRTQELAAVLQPGRDRTTLEVAAPR